MKKQSLRLIALLLVFCTVAAAFAACGKKTPDPTEAFHVDFVAELKLDTQSPTKKQEVTWGHRTHVDGDTSHFEVPTTFDPAGMVKARYLAVDTPETTGQIEEWGKAASRFTQEKLSTAASILIESDGNDWTFDGNGRYLCWVWYKPTADAEYRCLNIELLQNGLGAGSSAAKSRYGSIAVAAIAQASAEKLYMFSGQKDPDFPYGEANSVTLRELRTNAAQYIGKRVSVEGIVTYNSDWTAYIEAFDGETGMYYGMQVFYGYNSQLISVLAQGSLVRVVGVLSEYYGTYQIMDLKYNRMQPDNPANTAQLSKDQPVAFTETTAEQFTGSKTIPVNDGSKTFSYAELAVSTSISMKNLQVVHISTTTNPASPSQGAMTLTCTVDGKTVSVRTEVLKDADGNVITEAAYNGKTIDVRGIIEQYEGKYQIKVITAQDITVH